MVARIYKPSPTAMQSGKGKTDRWLLAYEPESDVAVEPLMGYTSSTDMNRQIKLFFDTPDIARAAIDARPVVGVSFTDAQAFCGHYGLKLPSEQEYERAARGTNGARFPWGSAPVDGGKANHGSDTCCGSDDSDGYAMTAPAESYPGGASQEGVLNLLGNVWEWTRDGYEGSERHKVLRGGAWIGALERGAVAATLVAGWPEGLAVVLALKGLGRYPELRNAGTGAVAERFIIGTFTSVLWAAACAAVVVLAR